VTYSWYRAPAWAFSDIRLIFTTDSVRVKALARQCDDRDWFDSVIVRRQLLLTLFSVRTWASSPYEPPAFIVITICNVFL
jgi:hypothetical protein